MKSACYIASIVRQAKYIEKGSYSNIKRVWKVNSQTKKIKEKTNIYEKIGINIRKIKLAIKIN